MYQYYWLVARSSQCHQLYRRHATGHCILEQPRLRYRAVARLPRLCRGDVGCHCTQRFRHKTYPTLEQVHV